MPSGSEANIITDLHAYNAGFTAGEAAAGGAPAGAPNTGGNFPIEIIFLDDGNDTWFEDYASYSQSAA